MRAIFFGTPELAVPSLDALASVAEVALVVCQPDRPAGRGLALRAPPVKERALALGLRVEQPTKLKDPALASALRALEADVALVVAYGRILPRAVLEAPRRGCVNVHASLLPRWRGAGPIQWAIVSGDAETGVCLMQMDEGLDTGPVIACERTAIDPDETAGALGARLSRLGAALVARELGPYVAGEREPVPQDPARATIAPLLEKEDGRVDWSAPARAVHDRVRGLSPWPGAFTTLSGARLMVHRTRPTDGAGAPGEVLRAEGDALVVACGEGAVALCELQLAGKRRLDARAFLSGHPVAVGARLGGS
ncbi:MAG: methionyl-tRNA formyltransferase [Sandaracinaceae bacterium]|nr:methionyl-tRNA formyltransferase [Sandaracinaceae bacterium]